jgi:hypothetical protein
MYEVPTLRVLGVGGDREWSESRSHNDGGNDCTREINYRGGSSHAKPHPAFAAWRIFL